MTKTKTYQIECPCGQDFELPVTVEDKPKKMKDGSSTMEVECPFCYKMVSFTVDEDLPRTETVLKGKYL